MRKMFITSGILMAYDICMLASKNSTFGDTNAYEYRTAVCFGIVITFIIGIFGSIVNSLKSSKSTDDVLKEIRDVESKNPERYAGKL